jgi:hypothetical protein
MVAHVDAFNGPRGGHSTNQDSHVRLVSTIVTMPVQTKALYTVMATFRPANPSWSKVPAAGCSMLFSFRRLVCTMGKIRYF